MNRRISQAKEAVKKAAGLPELGKMCSTTSPAHADCPTGEMPVGFSPVRKECSTTCTTLFDRAAVASPPPAVVVGAPRRVAERQAIEENAEPNLLAAAIGNGSIGAHWRALGLLKLVELVGADQAKALYNAKSWYKHVGQLRTLGIELPKPARAAYGSGIGQSSHRGFRGSERPQNSSLAMRDQGKRRRQEQLPRSEPLVPAGSAVSLRSRGGSAPYSPAASKSTRARVPRAARGPAKPGRIYRQVDLVDELRDSLGGAV